MTWLSECDSAKSTEDLRASGSFPGDNLPNFQTLVSKISNSLKKILAADDSRKKVFIEEQKAQNENS